MVPAQLHVSGCNGAAKLHMILPTFGGLAASWLSCGIGSPTAFMRGCDGHVNAQAVQLSSGARHVASSEPPLPQAGGAGDRSASPSLLGAAA